jgi:hypothetical protein
MRGLTPDAAGRRLACFVRGMPFTDFADRLDGKELKFQSSSGWPAGIDLFYQCGICGDIVASKPSDSVMCNCHNIRIDIDYGRFVAEGGDETVRLLKGTLRVANQGSP